MMIQACQAQKGGYCTGHTRSDLTPQGKESGDLLSNRDESIASNKGILLSLAYLGS